MIAFLTADDSLRLVNPGRCFFTVEIVHPYRIDGPSPQNRAVPDQVISSLPSIWSERQSQNSKSLAEWSPVNANEC